jgi:HSP20 family molecular chaperone IbpA
LYYYGTEESFKNIFSAVYIFDLATGSGADFHCTFFRYGSFAKSFTLPDNVNVDGIAANYTDGILTLSIAKKATGPVSIRKTIDVK